MRMHDKATFSAHDRGDVGNQVVAGAAQCSRVHNRVISTLPTLPMMEVSSVLFTPRQPGFTKPTSALEHRSLIDLLGHSAASPGSAFHRGALEWCAFHLGFPSCRWTLAGVSDVGVKNSPTREAGRARRGA